MNGGVDADRVHRLHRRIELAFAAVDQQDVGERFALLLQAAKRRLTTSRIEAKSSTPSTVRILNACSRA